MPSHDDENLLLLGTTDQVDGLNARFYNRFPFPWQPMKLDALADPDFETIMLNQDLGDWQHRTMPAEAEIWVAGCGTNQAVITALRFPKARILGSDISDRALEVCAKTAHELGIENLELRQESINAAGYQRRFDYVLCTGVIHHNARPELTLGRIATALKPTGILELMVHNRYSRAAPAALQKAIRVLSAGGAEPDFEQEFALAARLRDHFPAQNLLAALLDRSRDWAPELFADTVLQPLDHSFTVRSLGELAAACGLELLLPCINQYDRTARGIAWNLDFGEPELQRRYDELDDPQRWWVSELLLFEAGPALLWFYLRPESQKPRRSERQICADFLDGVFVRCATGQRSFLRGADSCYRPAPNSARLEYPTPHRDPDARRVLDLIDGEMPMRAIFERLGIGSDFHTANDLRMRLTTAAYPYLRAAPSGDEAAALGDIGVSPAGFQRRRRELLQRIKDRSG